MPKATRKEVFECIDGERRYQNLLPKGRSSGEELPVAGEVLLLDKLMGDVKAAYYQNAGDMEAIAVIRKIAAVAIRCMENHGVIERTW
jgi:hypothetical protein